MILIKQHTSHYTARLYLHLFCTAIDAFFYAKQLFPYLDYDVEAEAIHGIIYINVRLHSNAAKEFSHDIANLTIPNTSDSRTIAILQMAVDKQQVFNITGHTKADFKELDAQLGIIESQKWQNIDDLELIEPKKNQLETGILHMPTNGQKFPTENVSVTVSVADSFINTHSNMLPLFWHLATLTSEAIKPALRGELGFYGAKNTSPSKSHVAKVTRHYRAAATITQNIDIIQEVISDVTFDLQDTGAYERLVRELTMNALSFSSPLNISNKTGILIGKKGWKEISTIQNCDFILSHMNITVNTKKDKRVLSID